MRGSSVVACVLAAVVVPGLFAQTAPLNPTVRVLEKPQSIVPTDCETSLAPAAPRPPEVAVAPVVEPRDVPPPPAADLRTSLRRVQTAAESSDYASFKTALGDARRMVDSYPGGGEKQSASDVLQVYADLERLWDYTMTSPTGSFFDATSEDGAIIAALRRYPEFPRAVADATMNIGGRSIYPARETREFLVNQAAQRLRNLGVRTPSRVVQETPTPRSVQPVPRTTTPPRVTTTTPRTTTTSPRKTTTAPRSTVAKNSGSTRTETRGETRKSPAKAAAPQKQARLEPPRVTRREPAPQPQPRSTPAPVPVTPAPQPQPQPQPAPLTETAVTETTMTETSSPFTTDTASTTDTTATSTAPPATDTTVTQAPAPTTTTAPATPSRGVNLPFAIILIVIGIAVLVLLFRSSD